MPKASYVASDSGRHLSITCPGCDDWHVVRVEGNASPAWQFNGDLEKPTLSPSLLVTYPANPDAEEDFKEWRTKRVCHSFVREGMIQFLDDSTHHLAGQTVPLPEND